MALLNPYAPSRLGLLGDTLAGIGIGLLGQGPSTTPISPLAGVGQGLQYAQGLQGQRRNAASDQIREQIAQQQLGMQQARFDLEKQQIEDQKKQQADQQAAIAQWVQTQPPEQQALFQAFPDQAAKAYFDTQAQAGKPPPTRQIHRNGMIVDQQYDPHSGQWTDVGSGPQFAPPQPQQPPAEMQEYNADMAMRKAQGLPPIPIAEWKRSQTGGQMRYGLNPVYGTDAQGNTVLMLPNTQGGVQVVQPPAGIKVSPQAQFLNTGTAQVPVDKRTGQPIPGAAPVAIDNTGKATQEDLGKAISQAKQAVPALTDAVSNATAQIASIKNDPALPWATGWTGMALDKVPASEWRSLKTRIDQLKGTSFLQARQLLKGGGQITDYEGAMADRALNRMDTAQSSKDFVQALDEFQTAINQGLARMQYAAEGNFTQGGSSQFPMQTSPMPAAPATVPQPGVTEDGYQFKGGDPGDPKNWVKVQ